MKRITLSEIAGLAGVNPSTVSRALNPATADLISGEQRSRIVALCDKYNYRPKRSARGCATGKSYTIGFISGALQKDFSSPFISCYIAEIARELQRSNYSLTLLTVDNSSPDFHNSIRDILLSDIADGYITGAGMMKEQTEEISRCTGRPILTLRYHNIGSCSNFPFVKINIEPAIAEVWQLIRKNTVSPRCGFFAKPSNSSTSKLEKIKRLAPPGTEVKTFYIPDAVNYSLTDYIQAEKEAEKIWPQLAALDIIWCGSDLVAEGLSSVMRRHGMKPGKDIMIVGYDHISAVLPDFVSDIATIDPCWSKAGKLSAANILKLVKNPDSEDVSETVDAVFIPGKTLPFDPMLQHT